MNIPQNFDRWMFDYMEGNLSAKEAETFEQFMIQNPDFEVDADAWQNAIVPIDTAVYPNQNSLERKKRFAGWYGWSAAAALSLLIATGGVLLINSNSNSDANSTYDQFTKTDFTRSTRISSNSTTTVNNTTVSNTTQNGTNTALTGFANNNSNSFSSNNVNAIQTNVRGVGMNNGISGQMNSTNVDSGSDLILADNESETLAEKEEVYYSTVSAALKQEQEKYHSDDHTAQYTNNPSELNADLDLSKKYSVKYNSFSGALKKMYRKIERMLGYPVGLVNLRDPGLVLPENSLLSSNPGFTGGMLMPRFEMRYRNQWLGSDMNAHITQFSFDDYVEPLRGGFGFTLNSATYNNGAFGDYSVALSYSPKISLSKNVVLEPGVKVSLGVLTANASRFGENPDLELSRGLLLNNTVSSDVNRTDKLWYKDYGVGFVLNTKWFYTGFSADNLANHYGNVYGVEGNVEPIKTPVLYNAIIGADYESSNKKMTFSPFISARKFGDQTEAWAGMTFKLQQFTFAGAYSTNQDYTAAIGMKFKKFKMVYQYDRTQTLLTNQQIGSHSIGIRFNGEIKNTRFK